jgi:hypothetical protein
MPSQTGQLAFLGAARFQGLWNAGTNAATGSDLDGAPSGPYSNLFTAGASVNGGYHSSTNLTASAGDYWQITGSGAHNVDGQTDWDLNDWVIFSGSAGNPGWIKLAFEDTIASIVVGDLSSSSFHMGEANDKHVIFASGSVHSGSDNFTYDYNTNILYSPIISGSSNGIVLSGSNITMASGPGQDAVLTLKADDGQDANDTATITLYDGGTLYTQAEAVWFAPQTYFSAIAPSYANITAAGSGGINLEAIQGRVHVTASTGMYVTGNAVFRDDVQIDGVLHATTITGSGGSNLDLLSDADMVLVSNDGIYLKYGNDGAGNLRIHGGDGSEKVRVDTVGNVGIGTTAPSHTLSVTGTMAVSGNAVFHNDVQINGTLTGGSPLVVSGGLNLTGSLNVSGSASIYYDATALPAYRYLIISGSHVPGVPSGGGVVISGSNIIQTASTSITLNSDANINLNAAGNILIGAGTDGTIQFNAGNSSALMNFDEPAAGYHPSGSIKINDNIKLYFGTYPAGPESYVTGGYIEYNADGDQYMVISGSHNGIVLTGSTIVIDGTLTGGSPLIVSGGMNLTGSVNITGSLFVNGVSISGSGGGGSGTPGGSDTQVQYNDSGAFTGSANLTFDGSSLVATGSVEATSFFTTHAGFLNPVTFSTSIVVPDDHNGGLYGPLVFSGGNDLTIGTGSTMRIF